MRIFTLIIATLFLLQCSQTFSQSRHAVNFDGSNDHVQLSSSINLSNSDFTLECWFSTPAGGSNIIRLINVGNTGGSAYDQAHISFNRSDGRIYYSFSGDDGEYTWSGRDANWHHVAFTFNNTSKLGTLYLDGVSVSSKTFGGGLAGSGKATLGAPNWYAADYYIGALDEVRIWNTQRTANEVSSNRFSEVSASATGLVAYYKCNDGSGTSLADATSNAYNGVLTNGPTFVASGAPITVSGYGNAMHFDGSNDQVVSTLPGNALSTFTIEMRVKPDAVSQSQRGMFSWSYGNTDGGAMIIFQQDNSSGNEIKIYANGGYNITTSISLGVWTHFALSYDGTTFRLYKDGTLAGSYVGPLSNNLSNKVPRLGEGYSSFWKGQIDEFRIWNSALSQGTIDASKNTTVDPASAGLVTYYRFDQAIPGSTSNSTVSVVEDLSSSKRAGTITSFNYNATSSNFLANLSDDANLSALTISSGTLSPAFASGTTAYTASVSGATTSVTVTPTKSDVNATIDVRVNGGSYNSVTSGNPSGSLSLNSGSNTIDIRVTAQDLSTKTYTITVYRGNVATGGYITASGGYTIHTFTSSGTFSPSTSFSSEVLVVAGGGSGGNTSGPTGGGHYHGGGGGGGGVVQNNAVSITSNTPVTVTVGAGGASVTSGTGNNGSNSVFGAITATGGGGGGRYGGSGNAGGSGGGSGRDGGTGGLGTAGQGNNGATNSDAGGGGGAGAAGSGYNGGNGIQSSITGTATYYAGGGGGASASINQTPGGLGGGGRGGMSHLGGFSGEAGTANTGGGGGGAGIGLPSGAGGSGIVVVRYLDGAVSSNADLQSLTLSSGTLSPTFASNTTSYTATASGVSITVTPYLTDGRGTIQVRVNGGSYSSVTNNTASGSLSLNQGTNTVDVLVTAQDGVTTKTYTVTVTRPYAPGNGLAFDGSNDKAQSGNIGSLSSFTFESWIYNAGNAFSYVISVGDIGGNRKSSFYFNNNEIRWDGQLGSNNVILSGKTLATGTWHHVAAVKNGATVTLYVNGNQVGTVTGSSAETYSNSSVLLSSILNGSFFNGRLDEVRVWNTVRTAAEIKANMFSELNGNESGLLVYYNFNQGTADGDNSAITSVTDATSNGYNATLSNFSLANSNTTSNFIQSAAWNGYIGANNGSLTTAGNWVLNSVPGASDNALILSGKTVGMSGTTNLHSLFVESGATVNLTGTLRIAEAIVSNGTIDGSAGTLELNGTNGRQYIPASTFSGNTLASLTLNNSTGITLSGTLNLTGVLTPTAGSLTTGGNLVLKSSATGTARVAQGSGTYISGNVTVERYVPSKSTRKWSYLATPVSGNTIRNGWQDDVFITGAGTGGTICGTGGAQYNSNGFDASQNVSPSMYYYNVSQVNGSRWVSVANTTSTNLVPGTGYRLNIRGSRGASDANCADQLGSNPSAPGTATLSATGTLSQGNVTVSLNAPATHLYTLVGNPYASEIDFAAFRSDATANAGGGSNSANITNKFWAFSPQSSSNNFCTYSAGTTANFPGSNANPALIASGQAFFVEASSSSANGNVVFRESHKTSTTQNGNSMFRVNTWNELVRIKYSDATNTQLDEIVIRYGNDAEITQGINPYDAVTFNSGTFLASVKGSSRFAIQTRPSGFISDTVPMFVGATANGNYVLQFSEFTSFSPSVVIELQDLYTNTNTNIRVQDVYPFTIDANTASQGNRFRLVLRSNSTLPVSYINLTAQQKNNAVQLNWTVGGEINMDSYTVEKSTDGKNFRDIGTVAATGNNNAEVRYALVDNEPVNGTSYYRVRSKDKSGIIKYSLTVKLQSGKLFTVHTYPNPVKNDLNLVFTNDGNNVYSLRIINMQGVVMQQVNGVKPVNGLIRLDVAKLSAGVYTVEIVNAKGEKIIEKIYRQ